jgi:hypothetical protein
MEGNAMEKRARARFGAVALIGFGGAMLLHQIVPGYLHGSLTLATIALAFGALYTLAGERFRWAKAPAIVFSLISGLVFVASLPGHAMGTWWPLLLVAAGLWILRPRHFWVR